MFYLFALYVSNVSHVKHQKGNGYMDTHFILKAMYDVNFIIKLSELRQELNF